MLDDGRPLARNGGLASRHLSLCWDMTREEPTDENPGSEIQLAEIFRDLIRCIQYMTEFVYLTSYTIAANGGATAAPVFHDLIHMHHFMELFR